MYSSLSFFFLAVRLLHVSCDYGLYLAINPLGFEDDDGAVIRRRLEINWYGDEVAETDLIKITDESGADIVFNPSEQPDNFLITDIEVPYPSLEEMGYQRSCVFGYNATWWRDNEILTSGCLQSEPTWMADLRVSNPSFNDLEVGQLLLPGSHDAGAYKQYEGVEDNNWVTASVYAQEEDLLHQLIWGARFLDIRVGYYPSLEEKFWLVHGIIKTHPMKEGIEDVKTFLKNTREIVVWEINGWEQTWNSDAHEEFKTFLKQEFSDWLVVPGDLDWSLTVGEVMDQEGLPEGEGRLIITYNDDGYTEPELFFPEVFERWGNVDDPLALKAYLDTEVARARGNPDYQPWKPNCQMTPNAEDIIGGRWAGLREMADAVNRNVTGWWREEWSDLPATFSIHDFIKGTNMIQESIRRNNILAQNVFSFH